MPTVMALFQHAHDAERAISELSLIGYTEKDVSLVLFSTNPAVNPGNKGIWGWLSRGGFLGDTVDSSDGISILDGTGVGAVICSLIGTILGSEWRYGPVASGTAGLIAGGIIGFLIDRLIPEKRRDQLETNQISGLIMVSVTRIVAAEAEAAKRVLESCKAKQVAVLPSSDSTLYR